MIKQETKDALIAATSITPQAETKAANSETKIVVAPLLIYAAAAIITVIGIIYTAVYLGKPFQQYDYQLAESAHKHQPENNNAFTTTVVSAKATNNSASHSDTQESHKAEYKDSVTQIDSAEEKTQTRQTVFSSSETTPAPAKQSNSAVLNIVKHTPLVITNNSDENPQQRDTSSIPGYAFVIEQNKQTLGRLKQSQQRQINALRTQLSMQQSMIERSIKHIEHLHETHAASIKRHDEFRQAMYQKM